MYYPVLPSSMVFTHGSKTMWGGGGGCQLGLIVTVCKLSLYIRDSGGDGCDGKYTCCNNPVSQLLLFSYTKTKYRDPEKRNTLFSAPYFEN
jgi:hypothetical protein